MTGIHHPEGRFFADYLAAQLHYQQQLSWAPLLLFLLALLAAGAALAPRPGRGTLISLLLTGLWSWLGLAFFFTEAAQLGPLAYLPGMLSLMAAQQFFALGVIKARLNFAWPGGLRGWLGGGLILAGLGLYPLTQLVFASAAQQAATSMGLPAASSLFTVGILALANRPHAPGPICLPTLFALIFGCSGLVLDIAAEALLLLALPFGCYLIITAKRHPQP